MLIDRRSSVLLALGVGVMISASARAAAPEAPTSKHTISAPLSIAQRPALTTQPRRIRVENPQFVRRSQGPAGSVAGPPPGVTVYRNDGDLINIRVFTPGTGVSTGDDLHLIKNGCDLIYYEIGVFGFAESGSVFNVHAELRNGSTCDGSVAIEGTQADFVDVVNDGQTVTILSVTLPASVAIPGTVWLSLTFSAPDAGWVLGEEAEVGSTDDFFSVGGVAPCIFQFTDQLLHEGFIATLNCDIIGDPVGACCTAVDCAEMTELDCVGAGGTWMGAFTSCPCGACCSGDDFTTCNETTELGCSGANRLFHTLTTCGDNPCKQAFPAYVNDFNTGFFEAIPTDATWADDLSFAPCDEFVAFSIDVAGGDAPTESCPTPAPTFDVRTELWTNNDVGTPNDPNDDVPLAPIDGTLTLFIDIQADLLRHTLWAGPFPKIPLNEKVWLVISTNSCRAGPVFSGMPDPGSSLDAYAVLDDPLFPESFGTWLPGINFGGFIPDPVACPGGEGCVPAGSFRVKAWCQGERPKGTCCNDDAGTFVNGVQEAFCDGRWILDINGNADSFSPMCGTGACCSQLGCNNMLAEECDALGEQNVIPVFFTGGQLCSQITCPRVSCLSAQGDCFISHLNSGCDDPACCEAVCAMDEVCCTGQWDNFCVGFATASCVPALANDHCKNAMPIDGVGVFDFDTTIATTDGRPHQGCLDAGDQDHIIGDSWYLWTSPCNGTITVTTCDLSEVDTKLAVYNDSGSCPPSDAQLIACNDDACTADPTQSTVVFIAAVGEKKLIRLGMFPTDTPTRGAGQFRIQCGAPLNAECSGVGNCCEVNGSVGCDTTACCNAVCAADPSCCTDTWDAACAGTGRFGTGGGAATLCGECRLGGDLDGSGFVDRADWKLLVNVCLAGPGVAWSNGMCEAADFDSNGHIDMADINAFMQVFNTPAP